mmetsp:Transcript_8508/g.17745  ORF Transcript_8508/g.17745 Transcript_8508/m.17745 type:complete len:207 (+) Transcript_8508:62-682(+)
MPNQTSRGKKSSMKRLLFDNESDVEDSLKSHGSKSVQFSTIEIRDYSLCLGDHPDVNRGAPVSLDWEYESEQSFNLEEYEQRCSGKEKRTQQDMIRMAFEREYTLQKLGYSKEEIYTRSKSVKQDRKNRSQTRRTMIFEPFMIISEETRRWIAKKKEHRSKTNDEGNKTRRSSFQDSVSTEETSEMGSPFSHSPECITEPIIVCDQ